MSHYQIGERKPFNNNSIMGESFYMMGVYVLFEGYEVIYIGESANIRGRLESHRNDPCIRVATEYCIELNTRHKEREQELLIAYKVEFNRLPRCNQRF